MKVLVAHNYYQQPGGEDEVFHREADLLRWRGHEVVEYVEDNARLTSVPATQRLAELVWSRNARRSIEKVIRQKSLSIAHFHNTFALISPSAYYGCRRLGVPVVQSLHNPRLLCPSATLFRNGRLCTECAGRRLAWPGVLHSCYRGSMTATAAVALMVASHRAMGTWREMVDAYVVFTEFFRRQFIAGGLPPERVHVKPHFVQPDPGERTSRGDFALFIGRLDAEKGVLTLLRAWSRLRHVPLKVRGEGRLKSNIDDFTRRHPGHQVELVGRLPREQLTDLLKRCRFLVWPSEGFYETFGLVVIEAFACGVPVIASRIGAGEELVADGYTGLHFEPGDPESLASAVEWAVAHPSEMRDMGHNARLVYEEKYTAQRNYEMLMEIYRRAASRAGAGPRAPAREAFRAG